MCKILLQTCLLASHGNLPYYMLPVKTNRASGEKMKQNKRKCRWALLAGALGAAAVCYAAWGYDWHDVFDRETPFIINDCVVMDDGASVAVGADDISFSDELPPQQHILISYVAPDSESAVFDTIDMVDDGISEVDEGYSEARKVAVTTEGDVYVAGYCVTNRYPGEDGLVTCAFIGKLNTTNYSEFESEYFVLVSEANIPDLGRAVKGGVAINIVGSDVYFAATVGTGTQNIHVVKLDENLEESSAYWPKTYTGQRVVDLAIGTFGEAYVVSASKVICYDETNSTVPAWDTTISVGSDQPIPVGIEYAENAGEVVVGGHTEPLSLTGESYLFAVRYDTSGSEVLEKVDSNACEFAVGIHLEPNAEGAVVTAQRNDDFYAVRFNPTTATIFGDETVALTNGVPGASMYDGNGNIFIWGADFVSSSRRFRLARIPVAMNTYELFSNQGSSINSHQAQCIATNGTEIFAYGMDGIESMQIEQYDGP